MFYKQICTKIVQANRCNLNSFARVYSPSYNVKEKINSLVQETMENTPINNLKDWTKVRNTILENEHNRGRYTAKNIDALIVGICSNKQRYDLANNYLKYLESQNIKPNLATIGKYLKLLYLKNQEDCSKKDEALILKLCEDLSKEYPVLDSFTLENVVLALSVTKEWKKCLDLLKETKVSATPTTAAYSSVIAAAFLNDEEALAWDLLQEMRGYDKQAKSEAYLAYLKTVKKARRKAEKLERLEKLFGFFQDNDVKCEDRVALEVKDLGKSVGFDGRFTTVSYSGVCKNCQEKLSNFELSEEEFAQLKSKIFSNVIVGRDLFVKTNPQELRRFKEFVESMEEFDVVLDGLNVAYSMGTRQSPQVFSALLASVVNYFVEKGQSVLVLGRVHMTRWPKVNWNFVTQNATVFLTQNISQDDPYLLYCALNSGKDTVIVTRDLMRSHKFLLKDVELKMLFDRWLSQRQYQLTRLDDSKRPIFRTPPPFSLIAQKNNNNWHIPYVLPDVQNDKNAFHKTWLCLNSSR